MAGIGGAEAFSGMTERLSASSMAYDHCDGLPMGGPDMIRKLLLPAVAIALLGGCVTGYDYRGGRGDYYYGQPRTEYRYHGYGAYGYGYPYDSRYYGRGYYGYPYNYGYPYYPGYGGGYYPRPPIVVRPPRPGHPGHGGGDDDRPPHHDDGDDRAPWRNLDDLRRRKQGPEPGISRRVEPSQPMAPMPRPAVRPSAPPPRPAVQPRRSSGSSMGDRLREVRSSTQSREVEPR